MSNPLLLFRHSLIITTLLSAPHTYACFGGKDPDLDTKLSKISSSSGKKSVRIDDDPSISSTPRLDGPSSPSRSSQSASLRAATPVRLKEKDEKQELEEVEALYGSDAIAETLENLRASHGKRGSFVVNQKDLLKKALRELQRKHPAVQPISPDNIRRLESIQQTVSVEDVVEERDGSESSVDGSTQSKPKRSGSTKNDSQPETPRPLAFKPAESLTDDNKLILCLDGGGVRGIIELVILSEIEKMSGVPIAKACDLMVGTSTGGIISLLLNIPDDEDPSLPKYSAEDCLALYHDYGKMIFPKKPLHKGICCIKYGASEIADVADSYFGSLTMEESLTKVAVTSFNPSTYALQILKNYSHKGHNWYMRDAALATSAAPTYLKGRRLKKVAKTQGQPHYEKSAPIQYAIDGGVGGVNNPGMVALIDAYEQWGHSADVVMVSLGTGAEYTSIDFKDIYKAGGVKWLEKGLINLLLDAPNNATHYWLETLLNQIQTRFPSVQHDENLKMMRAQIDEKKKGWNLTPKQKKMVEADVNAIFSGWHQRIEEKAKSLNRSQHYFRLQPIIDSSMSKLDNVSKKNLTRLQNAATRYVSDHIAIIKELAAIFKKRFEIKEKMASDAELAKEAKKKKNNSQRLSIEAERKSSHERIHRKSTDRKLIEKEEDEPADAAALRKRQVSDLAKDEETKHKRQAKEELKKTRAAKKLAKGEGTDKDRIEFARSDSMRRRVKRIQSVAQELDEETPRKPEKKRSFAHSAPEKPSHFNLAKSARVPVYHEERDDGDSVSMEKSFESAPSELEGSVEQDSPRSGTERKIKTVQVPRRMKPEGSQASLTESQKPKNEGTSKESGPDSSIKKTAPQQEKHKKKVKKSKAKKTDVADDEKPPQRVKKRGHSREKSLAPSAATTQ